jgi:hypothetical protein
MIFLIKQPGNEVSRKKCYSHIKNTIVDNLCAVLDDSKVTLNSIHKQNKQERLEGETCRISYVYYRIILLIK